MTKQGCIERARFCLQAPSLPPALEPRAVSSKFDVCFCIMKKKSWIEMERHGLTELYSPREPNDIVAQYVSAKVLMKPGTTLLIHVPSIVFIHGLFGHPYNTWTWSKSRWKSPRPPEIQPSSHFSNRDKSPQSHGDHSSQKDDYPSLKNEELSLDEPEENSRLPDERGGQSAPDAVFWPKELLPKVTPNARIFTWGYDADVDALLSSASQNRIHEHADNLLIDLSDLLTSDSDHSIPLIFVVHSLGGIIVKDALNKSTANAGTRSKHIAPSTFGIIFLGTPHRGSKSASIGKIAYQITTVATKRPNLHLLRGLERNSEILDRIGDSFRQSVHRHELRLRSFHEEKETRKFMVFNSMVTFQPDSTPREDRSNLRQVVDAESAKIGDATEELGSIPSDHSHMTKYKSLDDIGFKRVSSQLRRWIEEIDNRDGRFIDKGLYDSRSSLTY